MHPGLCILDIAYQLPDRIVTNDDLRREHPEWDMSNVEARAGVRSRNWAAADETALDLAFRACDKLFRDHPELPSRVDAVMFCTQTPDYVMPANAQVLHKLLRLREDVLAFDYTLACSGYPYGLALARGLLVSGAAKDVLLVNADTYSKLTHPEDRSARVLFGDGAAVTWLSHSEKATAVFDVLCSTCGRFFDKFIVPAGGYRTPRSAETAKTATDESGNTRTLETIHMDGMGILSFVNSKVPKQVAAVLGRNGLRTEDINLFVFHQASRLVLESLGRLLRIPAAKVYSNLERVGNTVSASIPLALKDAWTEGRLSRGDLILVSGFGVGLSWSTAILEF